MNQNFDEKEDEINIITTILPFIIRERADRVPKMNALRSGDAYYNELLSLNTHPIRFDDRANDFRDRVAAEMWTSYQEYLARHRRR